MFKSKKINEIEGKLNELADKICQISLHLKALEQTMDKTGTTIHEYWFMIQDIKEEIENIKKIESKPKKAVKKNETTVKQ